MGDTTDLENPIIPSSDNYHNIMVQGTISDPDGVSDITFVAGVFYLSSIGYDSCVPSYSGDNISRPDCYYAECGLTPTSSTDATFECGFLFDETTIATTDGTAYASDDWSIAVHAVDSASNDVDTHFSAVHTEVGEVLSAAVPYPVTWGSLARGVTTDGSNNAAMGIFQKGNVPFNVTVSGSGDMSCTRGSIPLGNLTYIGTDTSGGTALTTTPTQVTDFTVPISTGSTDGSKNLYWNITIPSDSLISGTCTNVITVTVASAI